MTGKQEYMDTGYGPIDEEHRAISAQLRALLASVNAEDVEQTRAVARQVFKNVASHFAHEERLMTEWGYAKAARHRDAHASFLKDAANFAAELDAVGLTPGFRRWVLTRLSTWFNFHIIANDVELGIFLREHERRAAAGDAGEHVPQP